MISTRTVCKKGAKKMLPSKDNQHPAGCLLLFNAFLYLCLLVSGQAEGLQTSLLSSINLQVPSSSGSDSSPKPSSPSSLPSLSNLSRRDLSAKQTTIGTLYDRQSSEQVARSRQTKSQQQQQQQQTSVCQVLGGESVAIVEIEESRASDMSQSTNPVDLPITGLVDDEIELKIESETQRYFKIAGKQLKLIRPLDRDPVLNPNNSSKSQQTVLSPQVSSIYLQISCTDKRSIKDQTNKKNVIIPVLVKVLDLNDNVPRFDSPLYTVQVDELTPVGTILIDTIEAIDLDSTHNGQIEYSLFSADGQPIRRELQSQRLSSQRSALDKQTTLAGIGTIDELMTTRAQATSTTQKPSRLMGSTTDPSAGSKLDMFTTVASLSTDQPVSRTGSYEASTSATAARASQNRSPTINLNNEPIVNGPMEDGSEEEESDEALLASMNSTDTEMDGEPDSALGRYDSSRDPVAKRRRKKRSHLNRLYGSEPSLDRRMLLSSATSTSRNLWTNLMAGSEPLELSTLNPGSDGRSINDPAALNSPSVDADDGLFALDFAANTNRPIIRLKGELDYETKRVHYLTLVATDKAPNREDRLSSKASIVIRVLDGDDQGPAFVLEQSGCATGSLPQTTTASPSSPRVEQRQRRDLDPYKLSFADDIQIDPNQKEPPNNFKVTDENFDYSDATRGSTNSSSSSGGSSNSNDADIISENLSSGATIIDPSQAAETMSSGQAGESQLMNMTTRARRIVASDDKERGTFFTDYSCLSNTPISYSGQAEYFATVMSGDSDYVLKMKPQAIKARDRDELNAPIKYSFVNGTPDTFSRYFQINPLDASVKQVAPVDRSRISRFVIWLKAQEQTVKKLSSLAKLTIDVIPTDKNPPNLVPNSYSGYVEENSPIGALVMTSRSNNGSTGEPMIIRVIDGDDGQQQRMHQQQTTDNNPQEIGTFEFDTTSDAFKVNRDGYVYVNRAQLDRDSPNQAQVHMFQVTARQVGLASSKSISSPISVNVTLLDLNDNPPTIANSSLVPLQIKADGKSIRQLTTIKCVDLDEPANSKVRFSIYHVSNNGRDRFRLHPETGDLDALGKFNAGEQYSLTIQVTDELGRLSQGILEVSVVPGPNTGGPKFVFSQDDQQQRSLADSDRSASSPGYHVEINEGIAINSPILQVRAVDPENDPITYNIIDGNVNGDFYINSKTGTIYVANRLDREEVSGYKLLVQARDSGGLATNRPVTITILDNNDQNPVFQRPQYQFSVPEGRSSIGKIVGSVHALDSDAGLNGQVSYFDSSPTQQVSSDGQRALFAVDEQTGDIRLLEPLDYEGAKSHTLLVTARDNGDNPRSTTTSVLIKVLDVQDEQPYFELSYLELRVMENLANHKLVQLRAIDPDSVAHITYELKYGDSSLFSVDPQTGSVSTLAGLDYERSANHTIIVGSSDVQLSEEQLRWAQNGATGRPQVDQHNGEGGGARSAICRIDILVGDLNDVVPQFSSQPMPVRVQDTAQLGTMITRLSAEDQDGSEPNNQVRYELLKAAGDPDTTSCSSLFMIDPTSGVVSVRSDLKKSSHSECILMIGATDLGQPPLSSSVALTVYIDHVAEITPTSQMGFADTKFTIEMEENSAPNSLVKLLTVINKPKMVPNYPMSCEIVSGNEMGKFYVLENDQRDCELRLSKSTAVSGSLDYELKQRYSLTIRLNSIGSGGSISGAAGGTSKGATNLAQVNVNVLDRNDNRPTFNQPMRYSRLTQNRYLAAIAVDAPSETQLIQLRAQDLDSPHSNGLVTYELLNEGELGGRFRIDPTDGVVRTSRSVEDIPSSLLPLHLRILARDNPDQASDSLSSSAEVLVNLIEDRHRLVLILRDTMSGRVLDSREELLAILQERSGLIAGFERAESLKVQRNGTIESDVTGTDFWFYLIEPGTFRLVASDDVRIKGKLLDSRAQSSLKDVATQTLGFQDVNIRLPYSIVTGDPTLLGRTFFSSSHSSRSQLHPLSGSSFASSLITVAMIIAILSAIVIVYQCGSRSGRAPASSSKNDPCSPGSQYLQSLQQQAAAAAAVAVGDYSSFNFPKIGPNAFLVGQDNLALSGSAFSTSPSSVNPINGPLAKEPSSARHHLARDHHHQYQAELDRQASQMSSKEYETQMLKMSVLFDDAQSFDGRISHQNATHS